MQKDARRLDIRLCAEGDGRAGQLCAREMGSNIDRRQPTLFPAPALSPAYVAIDGALSCSKYLELNFYSHNSSTHS